MPLKVMSQNSHSLPISPAKSVVSINSSSSISRFEDDDFHAQKRSESSSPKASAFPTTPTSVENIIGKLTSDLSEIIQSKDETIEFLFTDCETAKHNALKAETIHLQEKAYLLETSGMEMAKGTAEIWKLRLEVAELNEEKTELAATFRAEAFQLKKDVLDLQAKKVKSELDVDILNKEMHKTKSGLEQQLVAKENLIKEAKLRAIEDSKQIAVKDEKINELNKEVDELNCENNQLSREIGDLKEQMRGYKRTWEEFKEGMDEKLWLDEKKSKKISHGEA